MGVGRRLLGELVRRASQEAFDLVCAFTHAPEFFVKTGFTVVPHAWVPEKIERACRSCALFRGCGQHAVALRLATDHA
jgi:N-acetylglutamate synthase-like GNAT family acetyltransferase